jgi:membrane AbrB-like protein
MRDLVLLLLVAATGAALAQAAGVPAGSLIGAVLASALLARRRPRAALPLELRNLAFAAIGVSMGAGLGPETLGQLSRWPISLAALVLSVAVTVALSTWMLRRLAGMDRQTAVLASMPGALSAVLAAAEERGADLRAVLVLQSVRLLSITLVLPPLLVLLERGAGPVPPPSAVLPPDMGWPWAAALLAGGWLVGRPLGRVGVPAPQVVGGVLLSGATHLGGWAAGPLPPILLFASFALIGALIGTRMAGVTAAELRRLGGLGFLQTALACAVALIAALAVVPLTGLPLDLVTVAFAPGGVEAMAAVALALGLDPLFVGLHHLLRIFLLIGALPLLPRRRAEGGPQGRA